MNKHEDCKKEVGCQHLRLSYCSKCKVVYCLDCGKEWSEYQSWGNYYYPYYPGTTTVGPYAYNTPSTTSGICSHG